MNCPSWKQDDGGLDDLRLGNVTRPASEIQAAMATELSGVEAGLVACRRFNEGGVANFRLVGGYVPGASTG
jgi:hypothetical protein